MQNAADLLLFIPTEQQIERCVFLVAYYYETYQENSGSMLKVCDLLLERLAVLSKSDYYLEYISIKRIQFLVRVHRM